MKCASKIFWKHSGELAKCLTNLRGFGISHGKNPAHTCPDADAVHERDKSRDTIFFLWTK